MKIVTVSLMIAVAATSVRAVSPTIQLNDPAAPGFADRLHTLLHKQQEDRQRDPLGALANDMSVIADNLDHQQTDQPVQTQEKQVVSQLDQLIAQLNQQCNGSGGSSNNPTKPMADSKITRGPGGSGPMHDPQAGTKQWGQLPPKEREKILQSQNDGFPPGYESVLSSYYSRLAQEQVAPAPSAAPTTQPAGQPGAHPVAQPAGRP